MGTNWAINPNINDGFPHLKSRYWEDNASMPGAGGGTGGTVVPKPGGDNTPEIM